MKTEKVLAITLRRTNFGEADRIVNFITPKGKMSGVARGARRQKSKLAGGIEIFSLNEVVVNVNNKEIKTIISARMKEFFSDIIKDLDRTEFGYLAIKNIAIRSENIHSADFFDLLLMTFRALNDFSTPLTIIEKWFWLRLNNISGEEINLIVDRNGSNLEANKMYNFDAYEQVFYLDERGHFGQNHIKFLRLMLAVEPKTLIKITGWLNILQDLDIIIRGFSGF